MTDFVESLRAALANRYAIERELGHGGMAIVYLATDLKHHRSVAMKVLRPELSASLAANRFLREIEIAAHLQHLHILPLYDSGEAAGQLYYVMPHVVGESLRDRLLREMQLPIHEAVTIAKEVAEALGYAHDHGVIHRDVKPDNILLSGGHALVADFGIARAIRSAHESTAGGSEGMVVGTVAYMSPEQAEGNADARSDIYALGCVLYEMLAGEPPFTGRTAHAVMARHAADPVRRVSTVRSTVPEPLEWVIVKALAKVPADRYATAQELIDALDAASRPRRDSSGRVARQTDAALQRDGLTPLSTDGRAIAVLPFVNVGEHPDKQYFSDGITDEMISALTRVPGLRVAPRTSVYAFKGKDVDLRTLGERLRVDTVLEGSVRWAGDGLRIDARLTDVSEGYNVWAGTFGRQLKDIFAIQEEISRAIVAELRLALSGRTAIPLVKRYTENVDAYQLYLEGRYFWNQRTPAALQRALQFYAQALAKDSKYAVAQSGLADAYIALSQFQYAPPREVLPKAEAAANRAVELDDSLAEAHCSLAHIYEVYHWRWAAADEEYVRALERDSNYATAYAWYADYLIQTGRADESFRRMQRARELEPLAIPIDFQAATLQYRARRFDDAIASYKRIIEMEPRYYVAYSFLGFASAMVGQFDEAIATLRRAVEVVGPLPGLQCSLGYLYARAGRRAEATNVLESVLERAKEAYLAPAVPVVLYGALGEKDAAFDWLARAYDERSILMPILQVEPTLDTIRDDPRFHAIVRKVFS